MAEHTIFMYSAIIVVLILSDSITDQISHLSGSDLFFARIHDINGAVTLSEDLSDRILDPSALTLSSRSVIILSVPTRAV